MKHFRWVLALAFTLCFVSMGFADSIDFSTMIPGTTLDHPAYFGNSHDFGPFRVTAWVFSNSVPGNSWQMSELTGRNDTGAPISDFDHGLGVCGEGPVGTNACTGTVNINELSSITAQRGNGLGMELLQIGLVSGASTKWNSITFSSLDKNGINNNYVQGQLFAGNGTPGTDLDPTHFATFLCTFTYDTATPLGPCNSPLDHTGLPAFDAKLTFLSDINSKYLYIWAPLRPANETDGSINDFLVRGVDANIPPPPDVPEPSSLMLLATGLAGASLGIRRKFRG